jgi:hypothetical protein
VIRTALNDFLSKEMREERESEQASLTARAREEAGTARR